MRRNPSSTVRDIAHRQVVTVDAAATLAQCGASMREQHVGSLVVVDKSRPVGIITDRDIVVEAVAQNLDPHKLFVGDVMAPTLGTVAEEDDLFDVLARMREHGVRRLPVVDATGALSGIISLDDAFAAIAEQLMRAVEVVGAERTKEETLRPAR